MNSKLQAPQVTVDEVSGLFILATNPDDRWDIDNIVCATVINNDDITIVITLGILAVDTNGVVTCTRVGDDVYVQPFILKGERDNDDAIVNAAIAAAFANLK